MQDIINIALDDEEVAEVFEGVSAGSKVKFTIEATVSEIDDERFSATIDMVHDDLEITDESDVEDEDDYEEEDDYEDDEYEEEEDE